MLLAYLAHPISDPRGHYWRKRNIRKADEIALELWRMGIACICPGKNTEDWDSALTYDQFMEGDLEMLRRCDFVVLAPRWESSKGARAEREEASRKGLKVYEWPDDMQALYDLAKGSKVPTNAVPVPQDSSWLARCLVGRVDPDPTREVTYRSDSSGSL